MLFRPQQSAPSGDPNFSFFYSPTEEERRNEPLFFPPHSFSSSWPLPLRAFLRFFPGSATYRLFPFFDVPLEGQDMTALLFVIFV